MTPEQHLIDLFAGNGIAVVERSNLVPAVYVRWGGSASDSGLVQGTFSVFVVQHYLDHVSELLGRIWRVLWESQDYVPLSVISEAVIPEEGTDYRITSQIVADTRYAWWDPEALALLG